MWQKMLFHMEMSKGWTYAALHFTRSSQETAGWTLDLFSLQSEAAIAAGPVVYPHKHIRAAQLLLLVPRSTVGQFDKPQLYWLLTKGERHHSSSPRCQRKSEIESMISPQSWRNHAPKTRGVLGEKTEFQLKIFKHNHFGEMFHSLK